MAMNLAADKVAFTTLFRNPLQVLRSPASHREFIICEKKFLQNFSLAYFVNYSFIFASTVKLGIKERFDKEQIGIKEPFPATNLPFTS